MFKHSKSSTLKHAKAYPITWHFKSGLVTRKSPCKSKQVDSEFVTIFEKIFSKNEQFALEMQKDLRNKLNMLRKLVK